MTHASSARPASTPGRLALGFAGRLGLASSVLVIVSCSILSWGLTDRASRAMNDAAIERGWMLVRGLATESELGVMAGDVETLRTSCERLLGRQDVASCAVLDAHGKRLVAVGETSLATGDGRRVVDESVPETLKDDPGGRRWIFEAPVTTTDLRTPREELQFGAREVNRSRVAPSPQIGRVEVSLSRESVQASQRRLWELAASFTGLITLLGVMAALALARATTRPLHDLAHAAEAIAEGRLDTEVAIESGDEIGALGASFNEMARSLRQSRAALFHQNRALEDTVRARTRQLEETNDELRKANQLKSEFLATVSHELRTPLNVIIGYIEILRETASSALGSDEQAMLAAIDRYSRQQLELVTSVLDFSRAASGQISIHVEPFSLEAALGDIAALHFDAIARSALSFRLDVDPRVSHLETDRVKLQEIVRNLLDNAVKFTSRGGIEITARPGDRTGLVRIEVRDTGTGISPEDLAHVFDEFRQVGQASTRPTGGVGLGLAIVNRLAEALGGSISVESTLGVGSVFRLQIPQRFRAREATRAIAAHGEHGDSAPHSVS